MAETATRITLENAPTVALTIHDPAIAYNFLRGYVDRLGLSQEHKDTNRFFRTEVARSAIALAASESSQGLGVWPRVFDAVQLEQEARILRNSCDH